MPNDQVPTLAITGGTGFVGRTLISLALAKGWHVRALTRRPQNPRAGISWVTGALDQPQSLDEMVAGADAVIHVAGVVRAEDRASFEHGNATGTLAVVEAAKRGRVSRFIHVSSLSAREPHLSDYGWSKAKAEAMVQASGASWTIVRPPGIFGPGDTEMIDLFKMARSGFVVMPPRGRASWIEVSDLCRLLLALVPDTDSIGQCYEVDDGAQQGWSHDGFAKAIGWAMGRDVTTLHMPKRALAIASRIDRLIRRGDARLTQDRVSYLCHDDWTIDPVKRPPETLWQPEVSTRSGLKATARAYRQDGLLS
jgi:uncharacterized protein YbjT (DUF2867 family)